MSIFGNAVGNIDIAKNYKLVMNDGTTLFGTMADESPIITATSNDIRKGLTAITENGVTEGVKEIPAYRTSAGYRLITPGSKFSIPMREYDRYDYTKIQAIITPYNGSFSDSVEAEKIILGDSVYDVNSTIVLSTISKNTETKSIDLNMTNETDKNYVIHYFTFREEE